MSDIMNSNLNKLLEGNIKIINVGSPRFCSDYEAQNISYTHLKWTPPADGNPELIEALDTIENYRDKIDAANQQVLDIITSGEGRLVAVETAIDVVPGMKKNTIYHAGPPIEFKDMPGPTKGAVIGAIIFEGLADTEEEALSLIKRGEIEFSPCHEHCSVGPMTGVLTASMAVNVIYNEIYNNYAYCSINEGLGKVLRMGANGPEVIEKLKWISTDFKKVIQQAVKLIDGGIDVKNVISQALQMGDECHNRNKAATSLFFREIAPAIMKTSFTDDEKVACLNFIKGNDHYALNLSMPFCKAILDPARGVNYSSVCICMARNGFEFGIQISSLPTEWFTYQANYIKGLYFTGYSEKDACRDLGDSAITETAGIGGFAMATAPAIVLFVGGKVGDAFKYSKQMDEICVGNNPQFAIPTLDFKPTATGIDIVKVVEIGVMPIINTGIAHKDAGIGQVGAGIVNPPAECFTKALLAFANHLRSINK